jgi:hypothetical protein
VHNLSTAIKARGLSMRGYRTRSSRLGMYMMMGGATHQRTWVCESACRKGHRLQNRQEETAVGKEQLCQTNILSDGEEIM